MEKFRTGRYRVSNRPWLVLPSGCWAVSRTDDGFRVTYYIKDRVNTSYHPLYRTFRSPVTVDGQPSWQGRLFVIIKCRSTDKMRNCSENVVRK